MILVAFLPYLTKVMVGSTRPWISRENPPLQSNDSGGTEFRKLYAKKSLQMMLINDDWN